jgi:hypothetical protein
MTHETASGKPLTDKQLAEDQQQQTEQQKRIRERAEALARRIGEACDELERLAEENPELVGRVTRGSEEHKEAYLRLKARLELADATPRCRWVRQDGTGCGSPQMKRHIYCFAHKQMAEAQALALMLPALEDANAIQVGLMRIQKALIDDTISTKKAGLLLYSMQLALQNVGQVTFGQAKAEKPVTETVSVEEAVREELGIGTSDHRGIETSENQNQENQNQDLLRMDEDGRGVEHRARQIVWRPSPDMFRMDTREGMEAYEASFRTKIGALGDREATPPRAAVPHGHGLPNEHAQTRINLG